MSTSRLRSPGFVVLAIICAAVIGLLPTTSAFMSGLKAIIAEAKLLANDIALIMGGTGVPTPDTEYINDVESLYLTPQFSNYTPEPVTTPEQFCPIVCNPAEPYLTFGQSVDQGVVDLNNAIDAAFQQGANNVAVLGYSQSATVATVEMNNLLAGAPPGELSHLNFVLLGDPNSPIGGILDRFQFPDGVSAFSLSPAPQHVPFLDIPLSLGTTPTSGIATDIYTAEYDGWANFPEDPSNILADINALIGIQTVHPTYPELPPPPETQFINLGTIGDTHFYDIPEKLPILSWMTGPAGQFFYDAFAPSTSLGIDWSYGNPGDPNAGIPVDGVDPIGVAGPWQVDATGQLVASGVDGFIPKMDPLQMLAGMEYAGVQTFVGPIDALLQDAGQAPLSQSVVDSLLSGYNSLNQLDASLLTEWTDLTASIPSLSPDAILDGSPLISGQPLIDLVGYGFDIFNFFGA
jgi:hypothetical protein